MGWSGPTPLNIPLPLHLTILLGVAAVIASLRLRHRVENTLTAYVVRGGALIAAAGVIAVILQRGVNTFYTAPSLLGGMATLLVMHFCARGMRWLAVDARESLLAVSPIAASAPATGGRLRLIAALRRPRARRLTLPAVALADALASVSAWSLLAFWILVALAHRHVASGMLMLTSAMLVLASVVLSPDTLAGRGLLPRGLDADDAIEEPKPLRSIRS